MARKKKGEVASALKAFLIELGIYSVLVVVYFFCVLHFLSDWLNHFEKEHLRIYAVVAVGLIIGQAVLLEGVTTWLMRLLQGGRSE